jgi:subtilisin-like proprotein convertase family protein
MKKGLLILALMLSIAPLAAQTGLWMEVSPDRAESLETIKDKVYSQNQHLLSVDLAGLRQSLAQAPEYGSGRGLTFTLPTIAGSEQFEIWETSNFSPALRAQFPDIKSYVGKGITDKGAYIRFSVDPARVETMVLRRDSGAEFIEPYSKDYSVYVLFDSKTREKNKLPFNCSTEDAALTNAVTDGMANRSSNQVFRTYRLALSCTGEYTAYFGGTVPGALAAMNATMTRVNGILDIDLAVKLQMIDGEASIIYTNASTDPYSNAAIGTTALGAQSWNVQLQNTLTNTIGNTAYDIGHLFGASGGGGNAGCIGCICVDDTPNTLDENKGSGYTSPSDNIPMGDNFDIDYVIHEMGHQMGANHTFSYNYEGSGVNIEPGSGVTIMGYAGVSGGYDIQGHSIPIYAYASINQIQSNLALTAHGCSVNTPLANTPPVVNAGLNYIIPKGTAFVLKGTGTDADGDPLTYVWEENDNGSGSTTQANSFASPTKASGPNWRTYMPTSSPNRICPQLGAVLSGNLRGTWESVSDVARNLKFTFTARDSHPNGGQTKTDNNQLTVSSTIGPFEVTSQADSGISWTQGSTQTITWNTNGAETLVGSSNVNILMSIDGGQTFPITLATAVPNDGSQDITVPDVTAEQCRIWIEPTGNLYFAVNAKPFSVGYNCNQASDSPDLPIPDGTGTPGNGATAIDTITVPQDAMISTSTMKVNVQVEHTYIGDLVIKLRHPSGTTRILFNHGCGTSAFSGINVTYMDGNPTLGTAACASPLTGTFQAVQNFSVFNGLSTAGAWQLQLTDNFAGDTGTLVSWGLDFGCTLGNAQFDTSDFAVFPNPNKGNFAIQYTSPVAHDVTITVHDIQGRKVFENKYTNTGLFYQNVQLTNAESGVYMVTVQDGDKRMVKKVMVN